MGKSAVQKPVEEPQMRVKNYKEFQHYKDRSPPWIKFYRSTLEDRKVSRLSDRAYRILTLCWLLAAEDRENKGKIPGIEDLSFRLRMSEQDISQGLQELDPFIEGAEEASRYHIASNSLDQSREEESREEENPPCVPPKQGDLLGDDPKPKRKSSNGTRIRDDWMLSPADIAFATQKGLTPQEIKDQGEKFHDHWKSKTGKDATKKDWGATWRNWVRNSISYGHAGPPKGNHQDRSRTARYAQHASDFGGEQ